MATAYPHGDGYLLLGPGYSGNYGHMETVYGAAVYPNGYGMP